jgi:hypothetical protein
MRVAPVGTGQERSVTNDECRVAATIESARDCFLPR